MLTLLTQIPTQCRGAVRSLVKAHPGWQAFITAKGKLSAQALNTDLIEFALKHATLTAQIEAVLSTGHLPGITDHIVMEAGDDFNAMAEEAFAPLGNVAAPVVAPADGYTLDSVLGAVDQFLSPLVRGELGKTLGPVIDAANRGPVTIEVERIVEVAPGEAPRKAAAPKARRDKKVTFRTLFPSKKADIWRDAPITLWTGAVSPRIDPFYVVDQEQIATIMTAIERGENCWLTGGPGTGKSTLPEYIAAITGRPFVSLGMTKQTEVEKLEGGTGLHNGATIWEDGALVRAMRQPGTIILIDELTFAPAGIQAIMQLVASEHRSLTIHSTGEVVKAADGVVFIVADNTNGSGDEGGLFAGTNVSNVALVTRFARMIHVDYLSPKAEAEALANHTSCPLPAARHLTDFVAQARRMPTLAGVVLSLRQMVAFVRMVQDGFSAKASFVATISSRMPATERATIEGLAILTWQDTFEALIHSKPVPATPSNSAAANAFADTEGQY